MKLLLASLLLTAGTFEDAKRGAVEVESARRAVAAISGACDVVDGAVSGECLENTKAWKEEVAGKRVVLNLGGGYENLLSYGGRVGAKTRFVWAPLYDVGTGLALTVGKPQKISESGNVVVGRRPIDGNSPDDLSDLDLKRLASTGSLGIEVVGRFGRPWSMNGGGRTVKGVAFEVEALRLYNTKNGNTVFESTQSLK
jgi:hypothetical protein